MNPNTTSTNAPPQFPKTSVPWLEEGCMNVGEASFDFDRALEVHSFLSFNSVSSFLTVSFPEYTHFPCWDQPEIGCSRSIQNRCPSTTPNPVG